MRNVPARALLALAAFACGGGSSSPTPSSVLITLSAAGVSPNPANAGSGASIHFVNNDSVAHQIASTGTACPELASGSIAAGKDAFVQLGAGPKTCTYNDALRPSATAFQGTINVAAPGTPGY